MRTDVHTHAFHPKIAHKAVAHLNDHYGITCAGIGTIDDLRGQCRASGIDRCVVLCAATAPAQVLPANNYAISLQKDYDDILAFGTIHPGYEGWEVELERLRRHGIVGLKLHPDFQNFWLNDARLLPIFEYAQEHFIFQIHIGDILPPEQNPSCPYKIVSLLESFPRMRLIATHLGGYRHWQESLEVLVGRDVWLETSSTTPYISDDLLRCILRKHDGDRILFGSDYPLHHAGEEMERLRCKGALSESALEKILNNADSIFKPL